MLKDVCCVEYIIIKSTFNFFLNVASRKTNIPMTYNTFLLDSTVQIRSNRKAAASVLLLRHHFMPSCFFVHF